MLKALRLMRGRRLRLNFRGLKCLVFIASPIFLLSQSLVIRDMDASLLIGVQVFTTDYSFSSISDTEGTISIEDWDRQGQLHFSSLGYADLKLSYVDLVSVDFNVRLIRSSIEIEEVVVFGRSTFSSQDMSMQIETIDARAIQKTQSQTAADALSQHGNVYVQKSQMGGGSPIIRGFEANRVLLVIDGVRMNNAIYRNGHLQNAITIDPSVLDRMDVIFGANSLLYGSDALGGVVHFQTRTPDFTLAGQGQSSTQAYVRHSTANDELTAHLDFSVANQKWSSLTSISHSDFGDLQVGSKRSAKYPNFGKREFYQVYLGSGNDAMISNENPNIQVGTAYSQTDVLQKLSYKVADHAQLQANVQYSTTSDVPRYDNLSEYRNGTLRFGEWYYGPQRRFLASLSYKEVRKTPLYDDMRIIASYQRIDEDRISRNFNSPIREIQNEDVHVYGLTADFTKLLKEDKLRMDYGADVQYNRVKSSAYELNIVSSERNEEVLTRYANDFNSLTNFGAFFFFSGHKADFKWNAGARYSLTSAQLRYRNSTLVDWPEDLLNGVTNHNGSVTGSIGATQSLANGWELNGILSTAFRSPNIDDLSKVRVNVDEITFPNTDLQPEKSFNIELSIDKPFDRGELKAIGFYTRLNNAIATADFTTPTGETSWISNGDTLQVVANQNLDRALVYGISFQANYELTEQWRLKGSYNWTRGRELVDGEANRPLGHIPPVYGHVDLSYQSGALSANAVWRYNGAKPIEEYGGTVDNPDLATPEGALAWSTYNLYMNYKVRSSITIGIAMENILDKHYRPFASGVSAGGRNVILSLRTSF